MAAVHDASCPSAACASHAQTLVDKLSRKVVSRLAQRVQREATGYYCGYTFKGQTIGKKYLLKASRSLDFMTPDLERKTPAQRMRRVSNKMFTDMMHRCMARPASEEWNLATSDHQHDVTNIPSLAEYKEFLEDRDFTKRSRVFLMLHALYNDGLDKAFEAWLSFKVQEATAKDKQIKKIKTKAASYLVLKP